MIGAVAPGLCRDGGREHGKRGECKNQVLHNFPFEGLARPGWGGPFLCHTTVGDAT